MLLGRGGATSLVERVCVAVGSGNILFTLRSDSNRRIVPKYRCDIRPLQLEAGGVGSDGGLCVKLRRV